jgi:hypothetical protein
MINKESYYGVEFTATLRANLEKISENLWANHIFKEKGQGDERSIVLRLDELLDFIHTTKQLLEYFESKQEARILEPSATSLSILYSRLVNVRSGFYH